MISGNRNGDALEKELVKAAKSINDRDAELFDRLDDTDVELPASLNEKVARIIDGQESATRSRRAAETFRRIGLRAAVALIAAAILTAPFITRVSAQAREEWRIRCDKFDYFYIVRYIPERPIDDAPRYVPPRTIENPRRPYVKSKDAVAHETANSETEYDVSYDLDGAEYILFQQRPLTVESITAVTSYNGTATTVDIGGYDGLIFEYSHSDMKFLFWNDGEYAYKLQSKFLTSSELIYSASHMK